jgi:hypothetical protein
MLVLFSQIYLFRNAYQYTTNGMVSLSMLRSQTKRALTQFSYLELSIKKVGIVKVMR